MDCTTQMTLGMLTTYRTRLMSGERIDLSEIPAVISLIAECPKQDHKLLCDHFAITLAANDNELDDVAVYKASLYLYAKDYTQGATVNKMYEVQ